ncbi:MAG: amidase family protein [Sneathiella sp.]
MIVEYEDYDALGLAELVKKKEVSALELLDTAIERTEKYNPELNAIVHTMYDKARVAASKELDLDAPFAGVPFVVKDLIAGVAGEPTTGSCKILADTVESADTELVTRFKKAGLVLFGKTNTPEFGIMGITESKFRGAAHNPWDLTKSTGGSSGGSGAAVAARIVPMAHGGDGGGSIRIPSSHCGLVGLLPSRGRNPMGPVIGDAWSGLSREHVLTRTVRDSAAMLDCLAGEDAGSPYAAPRTQKTSFLDACKKSDEPLMIAFTRDALYAGSIHSDNVAAVDHTAALLEALGHTVVEEKPVFDRHAYSKSYLQIVCAWIAWEIEQTAIKAGREIKFEDYELTSWIMGLVGQKSSALDLTNAIHNCHQAGRMMGAFHKKYDLFLTATTAQPPALIGELYPHGADAFAMQVLRRVPFKGLLNKALDTLAEDALSATPNTQLFNQTGQPAISLPLHRNKEGMPIGVQFAAEYGNEGVLYSIAAELELAHPWINLKPSLLSEISD